MPTGTVTLLLADVEGSTRMWQRDSDDARAALAVLDALVDELVEKFGGARPMEQGEGDSFVAGFARASDALMCALELQRRLLDEPLRLRVGLHTGEVEVRSDNRYDGPTIIRAARLRDLAHGGQTLVSTATWPLVQDVLSDGVDLIDLGSHRLKGLDRPERIYQLTHPELPGRFPPLRSAELGKGSVPVTLTSFVGRADELAEVQRLVSENRLVTLTGAGGCGKTRLAIEAAAHLHERFSDGVWFCDLGPVSDPAVVPQTLRMALGAREEVARSETKTVCIRLSGAEALVVLDNCEHLVGACAELADALLKSCPNVRVLTTSREPLGVQGEVSWRVPSMAAPQDAGSSLLEELARYDAVRLFVERAAQSRPSFALTVENAPAVAEICSRLDGIPLAIELAAARVRVLSVQDLVAGLNDRFRLLGRGSRTVLARQQTLEASVAWSYDMLSSAQQAALRRLAVFAGSFTLQAAEVVVATDDIRPAEVLELLSQLVDRSILLADDTEVVTRYRMLETIRQYARNRLVESGEAVEASRRHLRYFADWAEGVFSRVEAGEVELDDGIRSVSADYDNIRAACEWAFDDEDHETGLRLVASLERFWNYHASAREAAKWIESFLQRASDAAPVVRLRGLLALSAAYEYFNEFEAVAATGQEAVPLAREIGDRKLLYRLLMRLGGVIGLLDRNAGLALLQEAEELARAERDDMALAEILFNTSQVHFFNGDGLRAAREAVELSSPFGLAISARARLALAICLGVAGELERSAHEFQLAKEGLEAVGDEWMRTGCDGYFASVRYLQGDLEEARRLAAESVARCESMGREEGRGMFALACAAAEFAASRYAEAERYLGYVWPFFAEMPGPIGAGARMAARGIEAMIALGSSDATAARGAVKAALSEDDGVAEVGAVAIWAVPAYGSCARVERALGEISAAESHVVDGLRVAVREQAFAYAPDLLDVAAALRTDVGADADAARLFASATSARRLMGIVRSPDPTWDADADVAAVRDRLGEDTFTEAWTKGEEVSLDDAIAYALRGRGPRQRPRSGWDSLTPTELKVVDLVAQGLSNPQIAERLFVSRRTVSTHLSHVFAKLGVTSRAELAALAAKRG